MAFGVHEWTFRALPQGLPRSAQGFVLQGKILLLSAQQCWFQIGELYCEGYCFLFTESRGRCHGLPCVDNISLVLCQVLFELFQTRC